MSDKKIARELRMDGDGQIYYERLYTYNDKGQLILESIREDSPVEDGEQGYEDVWDFGYEYDENGRLTVRKEYNSEYGTTRTEYEYDASGKKIKEILYDEDLNEEWIDFEYEDDLLMQEVSADECGVIEKTVYRYDDAGNRKGQKIYDHDGEFCGGTDYEYDDTGRIVKTVTLSLDLEVIETVMHIYGPDGKLHHENCYDETDTLDHYLEYEYNGDGDCIRQTEYSFGGELLGTIEYTYA